MTRLRDLVSLFGRGRPAVVRFEQAVYGSFAFRDQGYALLARSPGCRDDWLADFRAACQNLGERPSGVAEAAGLFALRLASGPWAVVGVFPQGCDDRGRPGALAFHGLFLTPREYRKAGCNPFALAPALRDDWSAETHALPPGSWTVAPPADAGPDDPRAPAIVQALAAGRQVILESAVPIDALARQVWRGLPDRVRARASVATWAFGNANRFDLVAVPRLWGVPHEAAAVVPGPLSGELRPPPRREGRSPGPWVAVGVAAILSALGVGLALRGGRVADPVPEKASSPAAPARPSVSEPPRLVFPSGGAGEVGPDERRRVAEALTALADRFGVETGGEASSGDPSAVMERVARGLRYRGPFLSDAERGELGREPGRDAALVREWDARVRRFADDRPLPEGFRRGPLRWQLGVFAWSFHAERDAGVDPTAPRRSAAEVAQALAESLAVDVPLRPTPLSARYPAVASYLAFLGRLPRR